MPHAFISVSYKEGILPFAQLLDEKGWHIIASDGTLRDIQEQKGPRCHSIEWYTNFPHIFGGRVKGIHPKIVGGMLARAEPKDQDEAWKYHIPYIDLVIVNFYPFLKTVQSGVSEDVCIENIDVGGPTYVRAAAKNFNRVTVVVDPNDYPLVMDEIARNGNTSLETRHWLASKAFDYTFHYDAAIAHWFDAQLKKAPQ